MNNIIENWYNNDKGLLDIILSIDAITTNQNDAALLAFNEIAEYLHLPKQPENSIDERSDGSNIQTRSVFEELALINFMFPEEDMRGNVLLAMYNLHHKNYIEYNEVAIINYLDYNSIPDEYFIFFLGDTIDAHIMFFSLAIGKTLMESTGAKVMDKVLNY